MRDLSPSVAHGSSQISTRHGFQSLCDDPQAHDKQLM
jgi:hypothetical protein